MIRLRCGLIDMGIDLSVSHTLSSSLSIVFSTFAVRFTNFRVMNCINGTIVNFIIRKNRANSSIQSATNKE